MQRTETIDGGNDILAVVTRLLRDAKQDEDERRGAGRVPYFTRVVVKLHEDDEFQFSAFTRDISPLGIGLLHGHRLVEAQAVSVITRTRDDGLVRLRVRIDWCGPCGDGWYISGGTFLSGIVDQPWTPSE